MTISKGALVVLHTCVVHGECHGFARCQAGMASACSGDGVVVGSIGGADRTSLALSGGSRRRLAEASSVGWGWRHRESLRARQVGCDRRG